MYKSEQEKQYYNARDCEIIERVNNGDDRNIIAIDFGITRAAVDDVMWRYVDSRDPLQAERERARLRRVASHPCGLLKHKWPTCYGVGCYKQNRLKCDAWRACAAKRTPATAA